MALPAWIPEAWAQLSDENKKQASDFLQALLTKQKDGKGPKKTRLQFDTLKGQLDTLDHFDDPIPGFINLRTEV